MISDDSTVQISCSALSAMPGKAKIVHFLVNDSTTHICDGDMAVKKIAQCIIKLKIRPD